MQAYTAIEAFVFPQKENLTITVASSLREDSVSVDWGPRAESLLLLTNRGVSRGGKKDNKRL